MQNANVIPLFPERKPVVQQEAVIAAHRPCPDLSSYSLNQEQKERGLENLAKAREQLRERQLKPLREEGNALIVKGKQTEDVGEQVLISNRMKRLQDQAERITQRWS